MADYDFDLNDGKVHTRYSELIRCTVNQIERVLAEREGAQRFEGPNMADGTMRHEMWEEETRRTDKLPACFGLNLAVSHVEYEFSSELMPGVIVHSRPDAVCEAAGLLVDYKTVLDGSRGFKANVEGYRHASKRRQLFWYAYQLGLHGIRIREGAFLCEIWNGQRDAILGYEVVRFPITLADMAAALAWARPRIALLCAALEDRQKTTSSV